MQISDNINDMLEQWENVRHRPCPSSDNNDNLTGLENLNQYMSAKRVVDKLANLIRLSRLENNKKDEEVYSKQFLVLYNLFDKDFMYRILKN